MVDAPPDTPPPIALRAGELLRQRGVPYEEPATSPRESGVFSVVVCAARFLSAGGVDAPMPPPMLGDDIDPAPMSEPPMSLAPDNLARVLEALRARQ